ncbi:T9SS type A sorting domain-containing protein [Flavobacterium salilacus subsp. salilacus]|uniref:T9SS type A sorting domain-containing protein n=1 Tax=Flavobacterium TaxID=237 RepID=UPI00107553F9|nr:MULTISPECIES: T9SS type A sorting domain-containing protein [Flavobacterium]KAF2518842.1 T9SS type A sorting domain-containing protein [Flavobacterium salilacus subsp. salilacus]MBE1614999.1 T9SS type A sorting domain-containing protein [Flavobacterium sp. SaA2.13]
MDFKITFLALFSVFISANAQDVCFEPSNYVSGGFPNSVISTDLNGDGFPDIASTSIIGNMYNNVKVMINMGNGTYSALTGNSNFPVGTQPLQLVAGDFNEDDITDIATINSTGGNITILIGDGEGYFTPLSTFNINSGQQYPKGLVAADFNNDNHIDLAAGGGNNKVALFLGTGTGAFGEASFINLTGDNGIYNIAKADFNSDGNIDIVTANYIAGSVSVITGNGDGTFNTPTYITTGDSPRSVTPEDINHDNIPDLLVPNFDSGNISIHIGTGDGTFGEPTTYTVPNPSSIAVTDFNIDGITDLVVTNNEGSETSGVSVLLGNNNGDGTFEAPISFVGGLYATTVIIDDLNMDEKPDMVVSNYNSGDDGQKNISVFLNCTEITANTDKFSLNDLILYPSPASGQLNVQLPQGVILEKAIFYNTLGQKVLEGSTETTWNISGLANGVHFVTLITDKGSKQLRFVKE